MPSFCRHNRLESTCPVCSRKRRKEEQASGHAPKRPASRPASTRSPAQRAAASSGARRRAGGTMVVRRIARAAEDGFESDLVPGIRASADAALLAQEAAFAAARLEELRVQPPGLLGQAARLGRDGRREEALWLVTQIAAISPRESWQDNGPQDLGDDPGSGTDPFAAITAAAVPWAGGEIPAPSAELRGPRACADPAATLVAYRAWAGRSDGQAAGLGGEASWTAERRFDRAFERLALPGFARGARYEFLVLAGALGLADLRPASLHLLADPRDPVLAAAKRVFGFGDPIVVARRASELAAAAALPIGALDLALLNWARLADAPGAGRITAGSTAQPDDDVRALVAAALGLRDADEPEPDVDSGVGTAPEP